MANGPLGDMVRQIRHWAGRPADSQATDGELLERFVKQHDEAAFEVIVQRHGRVVFNTCQRILHDRHAAEDAFQATFLVLARRAHAIRKRDSLASWLFGVAYRVAVRAKARASRRGEEERQAAGMTPDDPGTVAAWRELRPVLDAELEHLPEKYRAPVLLCYFEGLSNEEAAQQLRWPPGTVKGRLARARELLRRRLERRGIALSAVTLTALLGGEAVAATVPEVLVRTTIQASGQVIAGQALTASLASAQAITLSEGVVHSMIMTKVKIAAAIVIALGLTSGIGWFTYQATAQNAPNGAVQNNANPADKPMDLKFQTIIKLPYGGPQKAQQRVASAQKDWDDLSKDYARFFQGQNQNPRPAAVDFTKQMAVEVALGQRQMGGFGVEITRIEQTKDGIVVHYKETTPNQNGGAGGALSSPFHLVRVDKGSGAVKFVKDAR